MPFALWQALRDIALSEFSDIVVHCVSFWLL